MQSANIPCSPSGSAIATSVAVDFGPCKSGHPMQDVLHGIFELLGDG